VPTILPVKKITSLYEIEKITAGNLSALKELLTVFISESTLQIQNLKNYLSEGNLRELKNSAHKIKSSFMLIGLGEYRALAEKVENTKDPFAGEAGKNSEKINAEVNELITVYTKAIEELKVRLKELA
jgi:HPt (histidine-containing phosphotransfer) domain-containing protein